MRMRTRGGEAEASDGMLLRLGVIREELERIKSVEDMASFLTVIAEGIHSGFILGIDFKLQWPVLTLKLELSDAPWRAGFITRIE